MHMPFGKHKGVPLSQLPDDYLKWLANEATLHGSFKRLVLSEYKARFEPKPKTEPKGSPKHGPGCWRCSFFEGLSKEQKELAAFMVDSWSNELVQDLRLNPNQLRGSLDASTVIQAIQTIRDMVTTKP